jgi:hypothetical protein
MENWLLERHWCALDVGHPRQRAAHRPGTLHRGDIRSMPILSVSDGACGAFSWRVGAAIPVDHQWPSSPSRESIPGRKTSRDASLATKRHVQRRCHRIGELGWVWFARACGLRREAPGRGGRGSLRRRPPHKSVSAELRPGPSAFAWLLVEARMPTLWRGPCDRFAADVGAGWDEIDSLVPSRCGCCVLPPCFLRWISTW